MNNLYNVNFKTDLALYDKFKVINSIKKEKNQNVLTQLIEKYVTENERFLDNPEIQEVIQSTEPKYYAEPDEWWKYIRRSDKDEMKKIVTRMTFQRYLVNRHLIDKGNESELKQSLQDSKFFLESEDGKFLQKNGIINTVDSLSILNYLSPIKII